MTNEVIRAEGLTKVFGSAHALTALDLHVLPGQVHAFLGPNGAGKSTTIRILLGLLKKTSGTVELLGGDPWRQAPELHRRLAYVPGDVTLWPNLSGGEIIDLLGRLRGGIDEVRRDELLERFALDPGKKARTYSKGNRQKVALVSAFAARAELLILDEPTSGLDPLMEEVFTQCLEEEKARGASILLSSHILSEVDRVADAVTIIKDGATVETGTLASLRHLSRTRVEATVSRPTDLSATAGVHDLRTDGDRLSFSVDTADLGRVLGELAAASPTSLTSRPPTLEELFLRHYDTAERGTR
ncbi:ABC transporter related protein OS=Tsukamurella paurometabola (strain ATCC 8368 / DSM / CCUG 35730 / CIP 100753 / JCM 10117 / KCTC 9821 / NBRC 16120 / NCIMB 702349 / NCTC 13040) OX=521096 GN=Tpau_0101 PE=4 SV=1 [Tsukamurella paurometabola]|uniref:ABC transporter related protein n=1 Tax=Tsukamurella paurometabola (strain ATCC 8368 / DSM 20162 / CCUG 35730 / CIP 100753 / JCM 10117 / KCTC 9821 / NBRC 16120 / NCIMB 702349 / NCTC 13040) TaxID=521096 RepID=D5UPY7_TSUPD|nr:ABC transporter ATP-binding protein [Tsukamurella paurometabola]ADG76755.1 ABC transporter related protein [Tsukamurella paurometabola DSM 20162]SUP41489.1 Daunorubicin/doxorubicin resistance ATP-binding protein DrrA [Tsukamurella paurometabola]